MRARMALAISGVEYEHREIALRQKPQAMLEASPKGTVPVFITHKENVIDESIAIMQYALSKNDPEHWLRDCTCLTQNFIDIMDGDFKFHLDRYKYASRYDETAKRGDVDLTHRAAALENLTNWETALESKPYLLDDEVSLADIATFPFIRQFAATEPEWWAGKPLPKTADWLSRLIESELFKSIMKKHPIWDETAVINR
jgi:glutathione S-transferase